MFFNCQVCYKTNLQKFKKQSPLINLPLDDNVSKKIMTIIMIPSYLSLTSMHRACQISEVSFLQWTLIYRSPSPHSAFRSNPPLLFKCLPRNIKPRISIDKKVQLHLTQRLTSHLCFQNLCQLIRYNRIWLW